MVNRSASFSLCLCFALAQSDLIWPFKPVVSYHLFCLSLRLEIIGVIYFCFQLNKRLYSIRVLCVLFVLISKDG